PLSAASSADAFTLRPLRQDNRALTIREQGLAREVAASEAPGQLAKRARELGLVQGAERGFLWGDRGGGARIRGSPVPAPSPPPPPKPTPTPTATPSGARPGATPTPAGSPRPGSTPTGTAPPSGPPRPSGTATASRTKPTPSPRTTARTSPKPTPTPGGTR